MRARRWRSSRVAARCCGSTATPKWHGQAQGELQVIRGAVYVDTGESTAGSAALTLRAGDVRINHVGTRFMTRVGAEHVQVSVRDGQVRMQQGADSRLAGRGEALVAQLNQPGSLALERAAPAGVDWQWADALAPAAPIEGRSLGAVLDTLAWQAGLELEFSDEALAEQARETVLHGPALALAPRAAIDTILATTTLQAVDAATEERGVLRIGAVRNAMQ